MHLLKALCSGVILCMAVGLVGLPKVLANVRTETAVLPVSTVSTVSTVSAISSTSTSSPAVKLIVDDELIPADTPPQIYQGRVMVPLRWVSEALGSRVTWDNKNKIVTVDTDFIPERNKSTQDIQAWIKGFPLSNNEPILADQGRVLVPARLIAEGLGASVEWVPKEQAVYVRFNATKGRNEWESTNIKQLSSLQFMQPVGWGFSRTIGAPTEKVQKQLDQSLDELLTVIKLGKRIDPIELKQPIRRVSVSVGEYIDSEGIKQYGGGFELSISGSYAKLVWRDTLSRPVYLHFSKDNLNSALHKAKELLPPPFPSLHATTTTLTSAVIKSDIIKTNLVAQDVLPFYYNLRLFKEPVTGDWGVIHQNYRNGTLIPELLTTKDGISWHTQQITAYGELQPYAISSLNDDENTLLITSSKDSSIYRTQRNEVKAEQKWKQVWEYPWPEAFDKYSPVQYIPDPVEANRVYTAFSHDTRFSSTKGLFMSEDSGLNWFESGINDFNNVQFVFPEPAVPDPQKAGIVYIEAALSMEVGNYMSYFLSDSLYMSRDAGRNWLQLEGIDELYDASVDGNRAVITAARHDSYRSYLLRSHDHGTTWSERKLPFKISDLKVDPDNPKVLLATAFSTPHIREMSYYSSDGGASWMRIELNQNHLLNWLPEKNLLYLQGAGAKDGVDVYRLEIYS